ncbi:MAG: Hint domain-containing protein, partial [Pseudomonadota bacterium]
GGRRLDAGGLAAAPRLRPIRIRAGALGPGAPGRDLLVSPQHRVLVGGPIARRMFGEGELLVPAKHLVGLGGIDVALDVETVEYRHILFDRHEIVFSEGAATESFFPGAEAMKTLAAPQRAELLSLFPELDAAGTPRWGPARAFAPGARARRLAARAERNGQPLGLPIGALVRGAASGAAAFRSL